ncbi:conserved hypothetical protein [Culex quinquefasciatus]|uniref:Uncharacterized protein n=1 Tax=Culex quinquefasciatus TaxID=7176 RepID=B0W643_CULQU|nr:conserved hypothetical protein [Culex quinquefasciatus]|eukprot:XP_001844177.1 conserved hypothetical protein [Culex quinquefasciatus]
MPTVIRSDIGSGGQLMVCGMTTGMVRCNGWYDRGERERTRTYSQCTSTYTTQLYQASSSAKVRRIPGNVQNARTGLHPGRVPAAPTIYTGGWANLRPRNNLLKEARKRRRITFRCRCKSKPKRPKRKRKRSGVTTMLEDPTELALKILRDAAETKKQKSPYIIKPVPIEVVTKAAMIFNRRFNNGLERESTINALAEMISAKNRGNKTNLMHPELAVIVEVIKGNRAGVLRAANICTWKGEDAKSQESTELADRNGKESGKKVAAENGARRWLLRNGEKKDPAKDEDGSQKESEQDALAEDIKKPEDEAAPKEEEA